jgi:hypothetical protein
MRNEKGVLNELGLALKAQTLTSQELVISTTAAIKRALSWACLSVFLASGPKGYAKSFPFKRSSQSPTMLMFM